MDIGKALYDIGIYKPYQRNFLHQFKGKGTTNQTELNYTPRQLEPLKQAIYNHNWEKNNIPDLADRVKRVQQMFIDEAKAKGVKNPYIPLQRYMEDVIDYNNYPVVMVPDDWGNKTAITFNSANQDQHNRAVNMDNQSYLMQGSIGAGDYSIDKNGNVILHDRYNFTQDKLGDGTHYTPMAMLGKMFGTPYEINLNLGNINDWGMSYTGNLFPEISRGYYNQ